MSSLKGVVLAKLLGAPYLGLGRGYCELLVVRHSPVPRVTVRRTSSDGLIVLRISTTTGYLAYDVKYGVYGHTALARLILPGRIYVATRRGLNLIAMALIKFTTCSIRNLVMELGVDAASNAWFTEDFIALDLLSRRSLGIGVVDPLLLTYSASWRGVVKPLASMFKLVLDFMTSKGLLRARDGMYSVTRKWLKAVGLSRRGLRSVAGEILRDLRLRLLEFIEPLTSVEAALVGLNSYGVGQAWGPPDPYSYVYLEVPGGLVPAHTGIPLEAGSYEERGLGSIINYTKLIMVRDDGVAQRLVVKRYREWRALKWAPVALWAGLGSEFSTGPSERLAREYYALLLLSSKGLPVPKPLYVDWSRRAMVREYVEGETLSKLIARGEGLDVYESLGRVVGDVHALGLSLGDLRPCNVIVEKSSRKPFLIDLEQASTRRDKSWDIAELVAFTLIDTRYDVGFTKKLLGRFVTGYTSRMPFDVVLKAFSYRYMRILAPIAPPPLMLAVKKHVERLVSA